MISFVVPYDERVSSGKYNTLSLFYIGMGGNENKTIRFREYHGGDTGRII